MLHSMKAEGAELFVAGVFYAWYRTPRQAKQAAAHVKFSSDIKLLDWNGNAIYEKTSNGWVKKGQNHAR